MEEWTQTRYKSGVGGNKGREQTKNKCLQGNRTVKTRGGLEQQLEKWASLGYNAAAAGGGGTGRGEDVSKRQCHLLPGSSLSLKGSSTSALLARASLSQLGIT